MLHALADIGQKNGAKQSFLCRPAKNLRIVPPTFRDKITPMILTSSKWATLLWDCLREGLSLEMELCLEVWLTCD